MKLVLILGLLLVSFGVAGAQDSSFDSNGVKIRYVTDGEGVPVVLVHGWLSDATMWGNPKPKAPEGVQVIAMDCRGHGKSDKPHDADKYGVEMAKDVIRLLDHLKIKKAHLIGYSMGAFIVGNVAATYPDRVLSVVYGGQAPLIVGQPTGSTEVDVFAKAVEDGKGLGPYLLAVMPKDGLKLTLEQANAIANKLYGGKDVKALALAGQSLGALAVRAEDLAKCRAPALFVYGSKEPESLKARVESLRKLLAGTEVKAIEGADHVTTLSKPAFGAAIVEFLLAHKR